MESLNIHLAYLFSSPLLFEVSGKYYDFLPPLSYKEELEGILDKIGEQKLAFRYRYMMATEQTLKQCLLDNPVGIHISCHGFENNEKLY